MFLRYQPRFNQESSLTWKMQKFAEDIDPSDVIGGGAKKMHSVAEHVTASNKSGKQLYFKPRYSSLMCFGAPSGFPTPTDTTPDISQGL